MLASVFRPAPQIMRTGESGLARYGECGTMTTHLLPGFSNRGES